MTRSPSLTKRSAPGPRDATTPMASCPTTGTARAPAQEPRAKSRSEWQTPAALMWTRASSVPGSGTGTSRTVTRPSTTRAAFMLWSATEDGNDRPSGHGVEGQVETDERRRRCLVDAELGHAHRVDGEHIAVVAVAGRRRGADVAGLAGVVAGVLRTLGQSVHRTAAGAAWELG